MAPSCLAEIPEFIDLLRNYRNQGAQIIGVTYPPVNRSRARRLAAKFRINYSLLFGTRQVAALYEVSRMRFETDSNFSIIFSFWDRIGGTFQLRKDGRPVNFGLDEYDGEEWQRVSGLLTTPFQTVTPRHTAD